MKRQNRNKIKAMLAFALLSTLFLNSTIAGEIFRQESQTNPTCVSTNSISIDIQAYDDESGSWVNSITKEKNKEIKFKIQVNNANGGVGLFVIVELPKNLRYNRASPIPLIADEGDDGIWIVQWGYAVGGGSRTIEFFATVDEVDEGTANAVVILSVGDDVETDDDTIKVTGEKGSSREFKFEPLFTVLFKKFFKALVEKFTYIQKFLN